jgi:hypothetical protein
MTRTHNSRYPNGLSAVALMAPARSAQCGSGAGNERGDASEPGSQGLSLRQIERQLT